MSKYPTWLKYLVNTIAEEWFFRFAVMVLLSYLVGGIWLIFWSALIFALAHRIFLNWLFVFIAFPFGWLLSWIFLKFGLYGGSLNILLTMVGCIAIHFMFGFLANKYIKVGN